MNTRQRLIQVTTVALIGLVVSSYVEQPVEATAPAGVTFTILNRAVVPEFDARRRYKDVIEAPPQPNPVWWIELEATRTIEVVTVLFTVQPGGHSGWHTHPGPALFTVSAGALTMYEGDDPSCTPQLFPAGTGSIEAGSADHIHLLRNETNTVAQTIVTFLLPVGAGLRTDLPDPGNCVF